MFFGSNQGKDVQKSDLSISNKVNGFGNHIFQKDTTSGLEEVRNHSTFVFAALAR